MEHNKVYVNSNVEFDETFFPMWTNGKRDYGIFDEQEQHGHEISTETQQADKVINVINHLPVENPTWDPKDIYVTPVDREFQRAFDEQITKLWPELTHTCEYHDIGYTFSISGDQSKNTGGQSER